MSLGCVVVLHKKTRCKGGSDLGLEVPLRGKIFFFFCFKGVSGVCVANEF
jgi:hypothetical protein